MARLPRLAVAGHLHLLMQRGHNGQAVFTDADDRIDYLQQLRSAALEHRVAIHAYALAVGELLLLATPTEADALGRMMQAVSRRFVRAHNLRHGRSGALWEGRFASTVVDAAAYGLACLRWIDSAADADDPTASSAPHHSGLAKAGWLTEPPAYWHLGNTPFEREARFLALLAQPQASQERKLLRDAASRGWVLGDKAFEATLAAYTGRRLLPLARGRPRKTVNVEWPTVPSPLKK